MRSWVLSTADCPRLKAGLSAGVFGWETQIAGSLVDLEFFTTDCPRQKAGLSARHEKCPETAQLEVGFLKT